MRGVDNIIPLMQLIVDQMTPVITITANVVDGDNWKLSMCETHWIKQGRKLTIGGVVYKVVSVSSDDYIIVSGASQPAVTWFQLPAPEFWHGSHRKVNAERVVKQDLRNDVVYLPIPDITDFNDEDSEVIYEANIRPLFLTGYDERYDNIADQQTMYIEPCNKMADYFITIVETLDTYFENPKDIYRREWPNFGDQNVWGNDKLIFNQKLSGVELRLTLEVFYEASCLCDSAEVVTCAPVTFQIEGVLVETIPSGDTFNLNLIDTDGNVPTHTYDPLTDTLEVPAAGGGGSIDIAVNGTPFYSSVSTNQNLPVKKSDTVTNIGSKVGPNWIIGDTSETYNGNAITGVTAEGFKDIVGKDSAGNDVGTVTADTESELEITIADVTQTLNGAAITNNKAETSKAITIRYANNDPVVVTPITDTETVFIGEVPNPLNTSNPFKTGQTTSYAANDDGALERGNGVSFTALSHNNYFGNTNRFTDDLGGQTYTSGWVIDWATWNQVTGDFIMWYKTAQTGATWANAIAGQPYNVGGFADCYLPNATEIGQLYNFELASALNYAPFNYTVAGTASNLWTTTTVPSATTTAIAFQGLVVEAARAKTLVIAFFVMRYGNISEL